MCALLRDFSGIRSHVGSSYGKALGLTSPALPRTMAALAPDAADLVIALHGKLLRNLALSEGVHFQGLRVVVAALRRTGRLLNTLARKLTAVDTAYNVCRHITSVSSQCFLDEVLGQVASRNHKTVVSVLPSEAAGEDMKQPVVVNRPHGGEVACSGESLCVTKNTEAFRLIAHPILDSYVAVPVAHSSSDVNLDVSHHLPASKPAIMDVPTIACSSADLVHAASSEPPAQSSLERFKLGDTVFVVGPVNTSRRCINNMVGKFVQFSQAGNVCITVACINEWISPRDLGHVILLEHHFGPS